MAAAAASTAHSHRPWPLVAAIANRSTGRPVIASAPNRAPLVCTRVSSGTGARPQSWARRRPPRRDVTAKAGAAEVRPSSSPDAVTYSSSISTDKPLYEPPGVSFDEYLLDRARVFRAMFPDESRSQRLSDVTSARALCFPISVGESMEK